LSVYNFTGTGKIDAETFQVGFQNNADLIEPGIDELYIRTSRFNSKPNKFKLVKKVADLTYEGEGVITE
jgi:accessory colonization factor AcfC